VQDEPALCSHGEQIRDFLYVKDVAGAFVALLESEVTGPVNIGSGQPVTLKNLVHGVAEILDRRDLVRLAVLPSPADEPPLLVADTVRLRDEVGWRPEYGLRSGLEETVEWWKRQGLGMIG
jgi:nucleoside-diphosphate-sugar epimerase